MRLFVGLDIPPDIRARLAEFVAELKRLHPDAKWVRNESWHVTLKFIGEQSPDQLSVINDSLAAISGESFKLNFKSLGFFPPARSPRIFWVGIDADTALARLAAAIDDSLGTLGVPREEHVYRPHLTLARSGSGRPQGTPGERNSACMYRLQQHVAEITPPEFGTMAASEFFLYESRTAPGGAQYTKLERFPLAGSNNANR